MAKLSFFSPVEGNLIDRWETAASDAAKTLPGIDDPNNLDDLFYSGNFVAWMQAVDKDLESWSSLITQKDISAFNDNFKRDFPEAFHGLFVEQLCYLLQYRYRHKMDWTTFEESAEPRLLSEVFTDDSFDQCFYVLKTINTVFVEVKAAVIDQNNNYCGGEDGKKMIRAWFQALLNKGKIPAPSKSKRSKLTRERLRILLINQIPGLDISVRSLFDNIPENHEFGKIRKQIETRYI